MAIICIEWREAKVQWLYLPPAEEKNSICAGLQGFDWEPVEVSGLAGFGLDGRGVFQGGEDC